MRQQHLDTQARHGGGDSAADATMAQLHNGIYIDTQESFLPGVDSENASKQQLASSAVSEQQQKNADFLDQSIVVRTEQALALDRKRAQSFAITRDNVVVAHLNHFDQFEIKEKAIIHCFKTLNANPDFGGPTEGSAYRRRKKFPESTAAKELKQKQKDAFESIQYDSLRTKQMSTLVMGLSESQWDSAKS